MQRPSGWKASPQAMAAISQRLRYHGHPELGREVDADTWLTPRYILDQLGLFDLDPCAAESCRDWTGARHTLTKTDDGLAQDWVGRVFMNPPFSVSASWLQKHAEHGAGISLVAASVESRVWRSHVWARAEAILLLHGRTRFCNPDGSMTQGRPLRSIALIGWSQEDAEILRKVTIAGALLTEWNVR